MTVALSKLESYALSPFKGVLGVITFDNSYDTGGEPLTLQQLSNNTIRIIRRLVIEGQQGYTFGYDEVNGLLLVYSGGIEVAGGTDLSGLSVRYDLLGESG